VRISCIVPFCRHTRGDRKGDPLKPGTEWICGDHWRLVDRQHRSAYGRYGKRWRRFGPPPRSREAHARLWAWLKRRAIERAAGI
jgi:hypothetical protein